MISVVILLLSIGVKLWLGLFNRKLGEKIDSKVMKAVFADSMGNVLATASTVVSLVLFSLTGINVDGIVGVGVAHCCHVGRRRDRERYAGTADRRGGGSGSLSEDQAFCGKNMTVSREPMI